MRDTCPSCARALKPTADPMRFQCAFGHTYAASELLKARPSSEHDLSVQSAIKTMRANGSAR